MSVVAAAALAFALSGCEGTTDYGETVDFTYTHATGANDVVVDYLTVGGFRAPGFPFTTVVRVMGDGTVLVNANDGASFDTFYELSGATDLQELLGAAQSAGLLDEPRDYSLPEGRLVEDAGTSVITIRNGETGQLVHEHAAEALGFEGTQTPARNDLAGYVDELVSRFEVPNASEAQVFKPDRVVLLISYVSNGSDNGGDKGSDDVVAWPGEPLSDDASCQVVKATPDVIKVLTQAEWSTRFADGGRVYEMSGRPVLPGDGDVCDGL